MIIQHHKFVDLYNRDQNIFTDAFGNIANTTALCNRIDTLAEQHYARFGYTEEEGSAKFKGDLFEIFIEIYLNLNKANVRVGVYGYIPTPVDAVGVDGVGIGVDGKVLTVQIKFRSNPLDELLADDIGQFTAISYRKYKVDVNTVNNLLLITTCKGMHWKTEKEVFCDSIRTINIDKLKSDIDNNEPFWLGLHDLIEETIEDRYKNPGTIKTTEEKLRYVQDRINELSIYPIDMSTVVGAITVEGRTLGGRLVEEYSQKRCYDRMQLTNLLSICLPTGAGKGHLMFSDLLNRIVNTTEKIFAISSHRIMLNKQHMKDMFKLSEPFLGEIGYIFVASDEYETTEYQDSEASFNTLLKNQGLVIGDLIKTVTNQADLRYQVELHRACGRKVVIISTYHSLDKLEGINLDVIYCDEAHTLASNNEFSNFKENYNKITANKHFFLTATPKDFYEPDEEVFLMNNRAIFGERIGMSFIVAVQQGYIVNGYYHLVSPTNYTPENGIGGNLNDRIEIVKKSYQEHGAHISARSAEPNKLGIKMLVKCRDVSTDMWKICNGEPENGVIGLKDSMPNVKIFAGGSILMEGGYTCYMNGEYITDRKKYLDALSNLTSEDNAIVLHYDILSEGINVSGFTGVMFLSGILSTDTKILQNIGRATRLHPIDRARLIAGEISVNDMTKWIKPFCNIIIPYWDSDSEETERQLVSLLGRLRQIGFQQAPIKMGIDEAISTTPEVDDDPLNIPDTARRNLSIEDLYHEIEEAEYLRVINAMPSLPFFYEINDLEKEEEIS